jgi:hypothetical protein
MELGAVWRPEQGHFAPTTAFAHAKARALELARAFIKQVG